MLATGSVSPSHTNGERTARLRRARSLIREGDGDRCRNIHTAVLQYLVERIEGKAAIFRALDTGVERAQDRSARHVADENEVIAIREEHGAALNFGRFAKPEDPRADKRSLHDLAQEVPAEFTIHVVDRDDGRAVEQESTEPLLGFLLV